jgi:hypothetical protein
MICLIVKCIVILVYIVTERYGLFTIKLAKIEYTFLLLEFKIIKEFLAKVLQRNT